MSALEILKSISEYAEVFVVTLFILVACITSLGLYRKKSDLRTERDSKDSVSTPIAMLFIFLAGVIAAVILVYLDMFSKTNFSKDPEAWGQAGDFFGGMLNPILAFASFIALLYTIKLQSKEMSDTRKEAEKSRLLQEKSAGIAEHHLKQQELFEAFKGLDSIFRSRNSEAKQYFYRLDSAGRSLQLVLTEKLNMLGLQVQMNAKDANKNRKEGESEIDWVNAGINVFHLRHAICNEILSNDSGLTAIARDYRITALYSLQAYSQLVKVTKELNHLSGLINIYAEDLVQNLLFSGLCHMQGELHNVESLNKVCPKLPAVMATLYDKYNLELKTEGENRDEQIAHDTPESA